MLKNKNRPNSILFLGFFIVSLLIIPLMDASLRFDEIFSTREFHQFTPFNPSAQDYKLNSVIDLSTEWRNYFQVYPPGHLFFYYFWERITGADEFLMRLPLFILFIIGLTYFFKAQTILYSEKLAALMSLCFCLFPFIYNSVTQIGPQASAISIGMIVFYYFLNSLKEKRINYKLCLFNLIWLSLSYFSIAFILTQLYIFKTDKSIAQRSFFIKLFSIVIILQIICYYLFFYHSSANYMILHWHKADISNYIKLFRFLLFGEAQF